MTLAETQALLHEAITSAAPLPRERLEACFAGTPDLPAGERVAIYAGMYRSRLTEALRETFPNLARCLGPDRLAALAGDYLARHPSEHHDIGQVGRRLAAFLREFPDPGRPDLAALAELEWARHQVFFAPPAAALGVEGFAALDPGALDRTGLRLSPALRALALDHDVVPLWRSLEEGLPPAPPAPARSTLAVWRVGHEVVHGTLAPDEALALERALDGGSLAGVCDAFATREAPAEAAHAALSSWIREGWIVALDGGRMQPPDRARGVGV